MNIQLGPFDRAGAEKKVRRRDAPRLHKSLKKEVFYANSQGTALNQLRSSHARPPEKSVEISGLGRPKNFFPLSRDDKKKDVIDEIKNMSLFGR